MTYKRGDFVEIHFRPSDNPDQDIKINGQVAEDSDDGEVQIRITIKDDGANLRKTGTTAK